MPARERVRRRRAGWLVAVAAVAAIAALAARDIALSRRIDALESAVTERSAADPLMPFECQSRPDRPLSGQSRDKPCIVSFQRLIDAPQQFQGRWVEVQGTYWSGFEQSELHPLDWVAPDRDHWPDPARAFWVGVEPFAPLDAQNRGVFIGHFRRGPDGHLDQYFASLDDR